MSTVPDLAREVARDQARGRRRRETVLVLLASLVVLPIAAASFGVELWQCLLLAGIASLAAAAIRFRPQDEMPVSWPEPVDLNRDQGARREVARLSWSVSDAQVGRLLRLRVRALATRRLARLGVDLDDPGQRPAAVDLLGADAVQVLDLDLRSPVSITAFDRAVRAIESLDAHLEPGRAAPVPTTASRGAR